ncbi:TetR/AcrR family transcriptional regulator [Paenibacillus solani]|uniref:TetR/AcrR family transcriptional regulator n=1 Tax=Paenibacillus solani TaxID=1705565 RepID=UPI003D27CD7C
MAKGLETRHNIIRKAAVIFNKKGFHGSSMTDIMQSTGLEKGGIYRHFRSKDELALEAFDYSVDVLRQTYRAAALQAQTAEGKLLAVLSVYAGQGQAPPLEGGCPLLNTAVDSDDTHPLLKQKARDAMEEWLYFLSRIVTEGIHAGEFRKDLQIEQVCVFLTSVFEGNIMMLQLFNNHQYTEHYLEQLKAYIHNCMK